MEVVIRKTKKILKTIGWSILLVLSMLVGFHIWFINHSEKTLERLIAWRSNGKLRAKIKKFSIDYINNNAEIKELTIFNADTVSRGTSYRFSTQELHFNIRSKWDLIFHKKLLVDSLIFSAPDIVIARKAQHDSTFKKLPLAEELGNVYNAINNSLTVLNLERFEMNEGKVTVKDAGTEAATRFELNHIFLSIDHLKIDSANIKSKHSFAFSDRVLLRVLKQTVKLPDNKSSISFNQLLIDSKLGVIEITQPRIKIYPPVGLNNRFDASAGQLNITGLDFNTLYFQPVIKIDSVFMQDPVGDLQLYREDKILKNKKQMPLNDALRNLPVAVNINHVVVQNGTVAVALHQNNKTAVFNTKKDNLSIVGISLNDTASNVLRIQGFNYILRNYIGYTPDSIYRYRFDSLQFIDNKIILYNFNIATLKKVQSILIRNYTVPKFEITDMDWPSFIFNNHFSAEKAVLYNAVFNIEKNNGANKSVIQKSNKKSIYQTLSVMDNLFDLDELKVVNGEFNAKQGEDLKLHIAHLNWDINANELTEAKTFKQLIQSVKELSFDTATATNAALALYVSKSNFNNRDKRLLFNHVLLSANNQSINASLNNVAVSDFTFNNKELDVNEIHWDGGNIHIDGRNINNKKIKPVNRKNYAFALNNISGNNSVLSFENDDIRAKINLRRLTAESLNKSADSIFQFNGLLVNGENAAIDLLDAQLKCDEVMINDGNKSVLKNISFIRKLKNDTIIAQLPVASFVPYINKSIISNIITVDSVEVLQPEVFLSVMKEENEEKVTARQMQLPMLNINGVHVKDAALHFNFNHDFDKSVFYSKQVSLNIQNIGTQTDKTVLFNNINLFSDDILLNKNDDIQFKIQGKVNMQARLFLFNPISKDWRFNLNQLTADGFNYTDKEKSRKFFVDKINVQNVVAANTDADEGLPWLINKSLATVSFNTLRWQTPTTHLLLNNFIFNAARKEIAIDSISVDPGQSRQEFDNKLIYRKAFLKASSGKILISGINYQDSLSRIVHITANHPVLDIYSDNLKKIKAHTIKALPVAALKKLGMPLQIDTFLLNNAAIDYAEINAVTQREGAVHFNTINGSIANILTRPASKDDSLRLDITANFMKQLPLHLNMQASYSDSLNGLALQLQVGGGNAKLLNPVLEPFVLLRAKSGIIDTMYMNAMANEYAAHGTMRLYYHGLNAELIDSGSVNHPRFKIRLFSFLANSFAIRNNNNKRITTFDFARVRAKSAVNYLLKMVVEGAAGNVMPQASKILIKKQLKKQAKVQAENKDNQ